METAILAGGCFWCIEAVYSKIKGVSSVRPGYIGGKEQNPSYGLVSSGVTDHAEAVRVRFDPEAISFEVLLEIFFTVHDPTSLNKQGSDEGKHYRSAIFFLNDDQRSRAEKFIEKQRSNYEQPIVTTLEKAGNFWLAETYHVSYFDKNPNAGYCNVVILPKLKKLEEKFPKLYKFDKF